MLGDPGEQRDAGGSRSSTSMALQHTPAQAGVTGG